MSELGGVDCVVSSVECSGVETVVNIELMLVDVIKWLELVEVVECVERCKVMNGGRWLVQ